MANEQWLNDPKVSEWLMIINTERTVENYSREFPIFMRFVIETTEYKTPTQIIESRAKQDKSDSMAEKRFWEDVGIKYMHSLEDKEYRKGTIAAYLRTMLSFFSKNHHKLQYSRNELIGAIRAKGKGRGTASSKDWIPDRDDVKMLYRFGDSPRDRAITLQLFQSGTSEVEVCNVLIEDFNFFDELGNWKINTNEHLYWSNERSKSRELFQTCISSECLEEIRIYLQSRGNPKQGHLFVSFRGQPLKTRDVNAIVKNIVEKAFNGRAKEWKTKNMRDGFMNALEQAKIPQKIADLMAGHKPDGAKSNYKVSEATIKMNYNDAFKFLSINGHAQQAKKLEEIMTIYSEKEKADTERFRQLTDLLTDIRTENKALKAELAEIKQGQETLNKTVDSIQKEQRNQSIEILELQDKAKIKPKPVKDTGT
jgi:integrase